MVEGIPGSPVPAGLIEKVKAVLLKPKEEWPKIAADPSTPAETATRYALPLIAIGPLAALIGGQVFGYGAFGITYRPGLMSSLGSAITQFVLMCIGVVVVAFVAFFLAPRFGGEANRRQAFKWVVYGATAAWIGGIFSLIPALGILGLLAALYSLYLFYTGAAPMMKVPEEKALGYTAVTVIAAILLQLVAGTVAGAVGGAAAVPGGAASDGRVESSGTLTIPGLGSIDTGRIERAAEQAEKIASGEIKPLTPAQLSPLLPASIGSYARVATASTAIGFGSRAEATYETGNRRFELSVTDMAAAGGIAGIASAIGVEHSQENADGYERVFKDGDRLVTEKWSKSGSRGSYGTIVADRFLIEASGDAASIDELKAAVTTIDAKDLSRLAS